MIKFKKIMKTEDVTLGDVMKFRHGKDIHPYKLDEIQIINKDGIDILKTKDNKYFAKPDLDGTYFWFRGEITDENIKPNYYYGVLGTTANDSFWMDKDKKNLKHAVDILNKFMEKIYVQLKENQND